jgi:hypothetical protein
MLASLKGESMPHRPKRKIRRPSWNLESDYFAREQRRVALVRDIQRQSLRFSEIGLECPNCDFPIWEAWLPDNALWRGCHCGSVCYPRQEPFDLEAWVQLTNHGDRVLTANMRRAASRN